MSGGGSGNGGKTGGSSSRPPSAREAMGGEGQRPTPVRLSMDAEREEPEPRDPPSTSIQRGEDEEWIVRVEGRTETGGPGDAGAPLLFLTFARADEPDNRIRETVRVGRRLDGLSETELLAALEDARPYEGGEWERSDLFAGTRKKRGG